MAKPAVIEARKAHAMQEMATQLAENNRRIDALTNAVTELALQMEAIKAALSEETKPAEETEAKPKAKAGAK